MYLVNILFYMNKIPFLTFFPHFSLPLGMPIESEIMDEFWHSTCLNDHIDPFYMIEPFWDHFGTILGPFWDHFETILGLFWDHFRTILGPFWDHFVTISDHFGTFLGQFWDHFGTNIFLGLFFWDYFGTFLILTSGDLFWPMRTYFDTKLSMSS